MWIDDKHRDMIVYALKTIRHEQEDAAAWGNHQAATNVTHIDAALAQLTELNNQPAATTQGAVYSHRNGETEPPTIKGRFWFIGTFNDDGSPMKSLVIIQTDEKHGVLLYPDFVDGWFTKEELIGQWWGPLVPPWEQQRPPRVLA